MAAAAPGAAAPAAAVADDEGEDVDKLLGELQADGVDDAPTPAGGKALDDKKMPDWEGGDF